MQRSKMLSVSSLSYSYTDFDLKDVSFTISPGEVVGFVGQNGAGKTTTIKCITGQLKSPTGRVELMDYTLADNPVEFKSNLAYICEDTNLYDCLTPLQFTKTFSVFFKYWDQERYNWLIDKFSLNEKKKLSEYSKGMKMKFHLAFALSHRASLLILDEPTSGLDPFIRNEFLDILKEAAESGTAVLFSTHITEDILRVATRIMFISNGEIQLDVPVQDIDCSMYCVDVADYHLLGDIPHSVLNVSANQYVLKINTKSKVPDLLASKIRALKFADLLNKLNNL